MIDVHADITSQQFPWYPVDDSQHGNRGMAYTQLTLLNGRDRRNAGEVDLVVTSSLDLSLHTNQPGRILVGKCSRLFSHAQFVLDANQSISSSHQ